VSVTFWHSVSDDFYQRLRRDLIQFLRRERAVDPEGLADETVARIIKIAEGGTTIDNLEAYVRGVARHVLDEDARKRGRLRTLNDSVADADTGQAAVEIAGIRVACLKWCKKKLFSPDEIRMLDAYYRGRGWRRIARRRKMAAELGISPNALRIRMFRMRRELQDCVEQCLKNIEPVK